MLGQVLSDERREWSLGARVVKNNFGHDLASAKQLTRIWSRSSIPKNRIYAIDHYSAKRPCKKPYGLPLFKQNIIEPLWNATT